jgi:3-hydroxyisobutyrate dehydrogenase
VGIDHNIGFVGLGKMGSGIAANLLKAGFKVRGYDLNEQALQAFVDKGGVAVGNLKELITSCDVIATCLLGRDSVPLADKELIPLAEPGKVFLEHSTIPVPEANRIGKAYRERGAEYLDAAISGGTTGAASGTLRLFIGGDRELAEHCWPLFEAAGNPEKIVYCGDVGAGQAAKVVQQMTHRFPDLARLEILAFGVHSGLDTETIIRALDVSPDSADRYAQLIEALSTGDLESRSYEFAEWEFFLAQARSEGFRMPMLEAMYEYCRSGAKKTHDGAGRSEPSVWHELMHPPKDSSD